MNKIDFISNVIVESGIADKNAVEAVIKGVATVIINAAKVGDDVQIAGLGIFKLKESAERQGVNPATGEKITIAASKSIAFKPAKAVKDALN